MMSGSRAARVEDGTIVIWDRKKLGNILRSVFCTFLSADFQTESTLLCYSDFLGKFDNQQGLHHTNVACCLVLSL